MRKKEFEAFDERVRALQGSVGDAETRMEALAAKDKNLIALSQKVDGLTKRFDALFAQADDLTKKQLALETLHEQLGQVDELSQEEPSCQMDSLRQSRQDLDVAAQGNPGLLQVARRDRQAPRQAGRRSRRRSRRSASG